MVSLFGDAPKGKWRAGWIWTGMGGNLAAESVSVRGASCVACGASHAILKVSELGVEWIDGDPTLIGRGCGAVETPSVTWAMREL